MLPLLLALLQPVNAGAADRPTLEPTPAVGRSFSGRARELSARAPRLRDTVTLDGTLSEAVWQQATVMKEFTSYNPVDGRPAQDNTEVRIWYAEDALYVGIRAYAPPGTVRATLAERDRIANDDWVAIHLDTFNDRRRSFVFAVNAFGVQADGMRADASAGPGVSRASLAGSRSVAGLRMAVQGAAARRRVLGGDAHSLQVHPLSVGVDAGLGIADCAADAAHRLSGHVGADFAGAAGVHAAGRVSARHDRHEARAGARPHADLGHLDHGQASRWYHGS
ncbi:MAG: carbohydrate binding family 9 domain-containing protein [Gemmatimonas sp.]|nr:carbohydrate binding family 9 domain-containing protein [Gemmatimonas sp.]